MILEWPAGWQTWKKFLAFWASELGEKKSFCRFFAEYKVKRRNREDSQSL
jgi:hypothetical protein